MAVVDSAMLGSASKRSHGLGYARLFRFAQIVIKRQSQQAKAEIFCYRATGFPGCPAASHLRLIQRKVVKYAQDSLLLQVSNQPLAIFERRHDQIKHVKRLLA